MDTELEKQVGRPTRRVGKPMNMSLPSDAAQRKQIPIATGLLDYFPLAVAEIARLSKIGNDHHNPGEPLHWDRTKSADESDALMRHFLQRGHVDNDGVRHSAKVAWRALAMLQKELEVEALEAENIPVFRRHHPVEPT